MKDERRTGSTRRALVAGLVLVSCSALLVASPLLLGRSSINRYLVAFGFIGALLGASVLLHGAWDWLAARRGG